MGMNNAICVCNRVCILLIIIILFLTQTYSSKDDPYILYAALLGNSTCDMLTLKTLKYNWMAELNEIDQKLLRRWQQQHQFILKGFTDQYRPLVNQSMKYDLLPQKIEQNWHIPFVKDSKRTCRLSELNETPNEWFCFKVE